MFVYGRNKVKVIIYDTDEMKSYDGYISNFEMEQPQELYSTTLEDSHMKTIPSPIRYANIVVDMVNQIVELDPTTMKRIAKYNLDKENEELLKEIEQRKKDIEILNNRYENMEKRLKTISDIGSDIWENGTEYEKEYDEYD